jgi:hypothetical protein
MRFWNAAWTEADELGLERAVERLGHGVEVAGVATTRLSRLDRG